MDENWCLVVDRSQRLGMVEMMKVIRDIRIRTAVNYCLTYGATFERERDRGGDFCVI